jgi:hypothetical protein
MQRKRFLATVAAGLGVIALIPVATAMGDDEDAGQPQGQTIEAVTALGSAFTYQGRLTDAGSPANGTYDLRFILYDAESAGAAVGTTQTKDDVVVTNGLFSVELDFGNAAWNGDARWVEIAVRPGSSTGTYTVLSPRQPVSPTPYALFAKASGGFAVPLEVTGTSAGAPSTPEGLVTISQTGTGIGLASNRTTTDGAAYPAILGTNSGGGAGVQGESTNADGIGVQGFAIGANGTAVSGTAIGASATGGKFVGPTAIDLSGAIKVSGASPAAFVHTVDNAGSGQNTCPGDELTIIDNPLTNDDPDAILLVVPRLGEGSAAFPDAQVGVVYDSSECAAAADKWAIYVHNAGATAAFGNGDTVNVLVIKQ